MSMQVFRSPAIPPPAQEAIIAIGNFDGVHRGHRALIAQAAALARNENRKLGILTFEPHPRRLFRPDDPPFRLTPSAVKERLLAACGIDFLFSLPFDWDFASQTAEKFMENVLENGLRPARIIIGDDFRFGQLRQGSAETLRAAGFAVTIAIKEKVQAEVISSSIIRQALAEGLIDKANALLGWPWEIEGIVVKGDQRGRTLGFPTANVQLVETLHPAYGVYASQVMIEGETQWRPAATNIGIRPMFKVPVGQVEAHILDFSGDIYGKTLRIRPVQRLRGEARFDSLEALVTQIGKDCNETRKALSAVRPDTA